MTFDLCFINFTLIQSVPHVLKIGNFGQNISLLGGVVGASSASNLVIVAISHKHPPQYIYFQ